MKSLIKGLFRFFTYFGIILLCSNCESPKDKNQSLIVEVKNNLDFSREEVISLKKQELSEFLENKSEENIQVKRKGKKEYLRTQWIDYNNDGVNDELLFQAKVDANSSVSYIIFQDSSNTATPSEVMAYSRFVPERIDDYTWENDKVAFRTYGPAAKTAALENQPGGVISSGIDLWFKSTDKSIINKWYLKNLEEEGYYHTDRGEGYDPYHVGSSRGTGGIGVFENDSLYVSENFISYNIIAQGPLRTIFELKYAPWSPYKIKETKQISLDLGSNFSKFESKFSSDKDVPNYAIGITLHKNEGDFEINEDAGWLLHWESIDESYVGEAVLVNSKLVDSAFSNTSETPDQSNLLMITEPSEKLVYYAGFAWEKSGQIKTREDWKKVLQQQKEIINKPLEVLLK